MIVELTFPEPRLMYFFCQFCDVCSCDYSVESIRPTMALFCDGVLSMWDFESLYGWPCFTMPEWFRFFYTRLSLVF